MKGVQEKLRLIYLPYLVISICFITLYSILNWLLFIKTDFIPLKEDITRFWLPFGLPWIPILIWLRPRIKLLRFKNDNASLGYQFLASMAIAFPTILTQEYLATATGKLTQMESITQYEQKEVTKYYSLKNCFIDKKNAGIINTARVSGKHNETLNLLIYVALPILSNSSDTVKGECSYFIGKKYSRTISNRLSEPEKEENLKSFAEQSQNEFDTMNFQNFVYLEKLGYSDDHDEFNEAVKKSNYVRYKDPIVFTAHSSEFENRNGGKFGWIFKAFGIGAFVWFVFLLIPKFHEESLARFKKGIKTKDTGYKEIFELLIPKEQFFVTPIIINLNILIYIIMVFAGLGFISFKGTDLLHWGANFRPYTINGQWWRLLTSIFLHSGLLHLVANMAALLFVGIFLEPLLGKRKYAIIYLSSGIIASCTSLWWHTASISIGASGAIFGLYGLFLAFLLLKVFPRDFSKAFLFSTLFFVGYNLIIGLTGGIDNAAHIGGLLSGFIIGLLLTPSLRGETKSKKIT
jgi:rhomboid protease GluP